MTRLRTYTQSARPTGLPYLYVRPIRPDSNPER